MLTGWDSKPGLIRGDGHGVSWFEGERAFYVSVSGLEIVWSEEGLRYHCSVVRTEDEGSG